MVNLWQSGEAFEKAGGKRERGLLFLGAPGTGKTMLRRRSRRASTASRRGGFLTKEGLSSFGETDGTTQNVSTKTANGSPPKSGRFGEQPLVEIELRPGVHTGRTSGSLVHATPDHRWVTRTGASSPTSPQVTSSPSAVRSDRNRISRPSFGASATGTEPRWAGPCPNPSLRQKDQQWLPLFKEYGHSFMSYPPSYGGDPLVVFNGGQMSAWKEPPTGAEVPHGSRAGSRDILAADGWSLADGAIMLETQDAEADHS